VLGAVVTLHCATSFAIASLIVRHPRVRLAFSQGGGASGLVMPRLMHAWKSLAPVTGLIERLPLEQARGLYHARWSMTSRRCAS
jgi:aminocarboxymuconate-semialdehyde decarboxylase